MQFDLDRMQAADRYELLLGTIVPRPIALITTVAESGTVNAAPYSLFNIMSHDPPIMVVSVLPHAEGRFKDTANNIFATREFVASLVSEELAEAMNVTCIDAPAGTNELEIAHLGTVASTAVRPPRIAGSPAAFECRFLQSLSFGPSQAIIVAQILHAHVDDRFVLDAGHGLVDTPGLKLFGAMHGAKWYSRTSDRFEMERPTWADWARQDKA